MKNNTSSFGIGFAQEFPGLSAQLAAKTAQSTGLDPSEPANITASMHSNVFKTEAMKATSAKDTAAIDAVFAPPKFAPNSASQEVQTGAAYDAKESSITAGMAVKRTLYEQSTEAQSQLAQLANFNKEEYTNTRLREMNPVKEIDQRMLELRMQAFSAEAMLETDPEVMALPPAAQARVLASRRGVFADAISSLSRMRDIRLSAAKDQIGKELGAKESQINVAQSRIDGIESQIKQIEDIGGDQNAIASLRLDRIKEEERLRKMRGNGAMSTIKEFIYNAQIEDFKITHDRLPSASEITELKRMNEKMSKDPNTVNDIMNPRQLPNPYASTGIPQGSPGLSVLTPGDTKRLRLGQNKISVSGEEFDKTTAEFLDIAKKFEDAGEDGKAQEYRNRAAGRRVDQDE